jgi:acyl carrier protein
MRRNGVSTDVSSRVREFIVSEIMYEDDASTLTEDTPLIGGIMDSLGLMQLVNFIEEEFGVTIEDLEVTADNFQTIGAIDRLVSGKAKVGDDRTEGAS